MHPTPVIEYLNNRKIPLFRLNTEALLTDYEFCWQGSTKSLDFYIKNIRTGLELHGHDVSSVWERRPVLPSELPYDNGQEINKHNLEEAGGFLSFLLYYISDKFSIGNHLYDRSAASKMLQLKIAQELDMQIPATCFSNRKADIVTFARKHEYIVLKSIESDNLWLGDEHEYVFYAQKIKSTLLDTNPDESFYQTVSFVQNYIEKQFELRVTVVGNTVFACKIDSQAMEDDKGKIDWRQGYDHGLKHEKYELPTHVINFCREFLKRMHLHFGCFDFIVTPTGEFVFLECNPNGQWLWIERQTGMKISEAIANCLIKGTVYPTSSHAIPADIY